MTIPGHGFVLVLLVATMLLAARAPVAALTHGQGYVPARVPFSSKIANAATSVVLPYAVLHLVSSPGARMWAHAAGGKPKSAAYWDKLLADEERVKKVEDEWAAGDEEEELITEGQIEYQNMERRKAKLASPKDFDVNDPSEWMAHQESTAGPTMMFAKLNHTRKDGSKLTREDTQELAAMWKELLFTGGVECTPYDIEWDTVLMTLQRGWNGFQMKDFLLSREEVLKVTWNSRDYLKEGVSEADLEGGASEEASSAENRKTKKSKNHRRKEKKGKSKKKKKKKMMKKKPKKSKRTKKKPKSKNTKKKAEKSEL